MTESINRKVARRFSRAVENNNFTSTGSIAGQAVFYDSTSDLPTSNIANGSQGYVVSNQRLYIRGTGGWYNIATINNSPSISSVRSDSGLSSPFNLAKDGITTTVIKINATDSEGFPLTFTATTDVGFDSIGTVSSQDSSVFTITPFSEESAGTATTGTITFKASDGVNIASEVASFVLTFKIYTLEQSVPSSSTTTADTFDAGTSLTFNSYGQWRFTPGENMVVDLKMWGAAGAAGHHTNYTQTDITSTANSNTYGGAGGYSHGRVSLSSDTSYVIRVGQGGYRSRTVDGTHPQNATFLAGGIHPNYNTTYYMALGGGYTGFFDSGGAHSDSIMLAGGGGGGGFGFAAGSYAGGGSTGQGGTNQNGGGGTQSAGGAAGAYNNPGAGSALTGGHGNQTYGNNTAGGGGGYYGGGGSNIGPGGGGSGYLDSSVVSNGVTAAGNGSTPPYSSDGDRGNAGAGTSLVGYDGLIKITRVS